LNFFSKKIEKNQKKYSTIFFKGTLRHLALLGVTFGVTSRYGEINFYEIIFEKKYFLNLKSIVT
jgi:hypothetical protein